VLEVVVLVVNVRDDEQVVWCEEEVLAGFGWVVVVERRF
jgi:hypothetical protein